MDYPIFTGVNDQPLTEEESLKLYRHEERGFASATPLNWQEITDAEVIARSLPVKRQYYTSECVAQAFTKHLGKNHQIDVGEYIDLAAGFFYSFRANQFSGGMNWLDACKLALNKAACRHERIKQRIHEYDPKPVITKEMIIEALDFIGLAYFTLEDINVDNIAEMIEKQGSCVMFTYFESSSDEWWRTNPIILNESLYTFSPQAGRHGIYADKYGLRNGKKNIIIDDSAGNNSALGEQNRFMDEEWVNKRIYVAGYVVDKKNLPTPDILKPKVQLTQLLKSGSNGSEVSQLQLVLMYEKLLHIEVPTGKFRGWTHAAVKEYQAKNGLKPDGIVGPITRKHINNKYK